MENLFDKYDYVAFPLTTVSLARELKKIINDYKNKKINNKEVEEIVNFYASTQANKLFNGEELNITVQRLNGKQRSEVIKSLLMKH